jgi:hypothetical protein
LSVRQIATGAMLFLLVPLAGCGEKKINSEDLEQKLKTELGKDAGVEPKSVSCPDDIKAEKGKKFNCTLVAPNGDELIVNVTLTNDKGGFQATVPPQQGK